MILTNYNLTLSLVFSLAILLILKDTSALNLLLIEYIFPNMFFLMKMSSCVLSLHLCPLVPHFLQLHHSFPLFQLGCLIFCTLLLLLHSPHLLLYLSLLSLLTLLHNPLFRSLLSHMTLSYPLLLLSLQYLCLPLLLLHSLHLLTLLFLHLYILLYLHKPLPNQPQILTPWSQGPKLVSQNPKPTLLSLPLLTIPLLNLQLNFLNGVQPWMRNLMPCKDLGDLHYILGLQIIRTAKGLFLNQAKYAHDLLVKHNMLYIQACKDSLCSSHETCSQ